MFDRCQRVLAVALLFMSSPTPADLPLTVEDLLTSAQRWRVELGVAYANSDRTAVTTDQAVPIQIGPTQFITVPTVVGERRVNNDVVVLSPGIRYGLNSDTELYGRFSAVSSTLRSDSVSGVDAQNDERVADAWLGVNHRFVKEGESPALLGFFELAAAENVATSGTNLAHGKSALFGFTTYRAIDPIVLSLTSAYRWNRSRDVADQARDPGDLFLLNPSIGFAVNNEITLTTGLSWRWQKADRVNNITQGIRTTQTSLAMGVGHAWSQRLTLNVNTRADISGRGGAEIDFTLLYKLGELPKRERGKQTPKGGD